jgi:esterase
MTRPTLHHEKISGAAAAPMRWALVLHGVFGSGRNWATVARRFVEQRSDWGVVLVDLPGHGRSTGFPAPLTIETAAQDVVALAVHLGIQDHAIIGHSLGGKVALRYAAMKPAGLKKVFVIDAPPGPMAAGGESWEVLRMLQRLPRRFESRDAAVRVLEAAGIAKPIAVWLAMNLVPADGGMIWRIDLDAMEPLLRSFFAADGWPVIEAAGGPEVHVVRATISSAIDDASAARIERSARLHTIAGGHWLNADNPAAMAQLLAELL